MIKEALLVVSMIGGSGNGAFGGESVTLVPSMETCAISMRAFQASKGNQYHVVNSGNSVKFTQDIDWGIDRQYRVECIPLSEATANPTQEF